jgi:hypothetical protein
MYEIDDEKLLYISYRKPGIYKKPLYSKHSKKSLIRLEVFLYFLF